MTVEIDKMKWLRTYLVTEDDDNADLTLDLLVDSDNLVVDRVPFCGWWGRLKSTEILPVVVHPNARVDFGSDEDTDQETRFGQLSLTGSKIERGATFQFVVDDDLYHLTVESCRDLTEGVI